ncbi:MAG: radical SAM protein [Alphaproteobacteria bacterium]|nr:radical SAM protein [Alphaproteobacteria bacterium]
MQSAVPVAEASSAESPHEPAHIAARIARWADDGRQGPMTLELYPTLACNLDCQFCDTTDRHRPPVDELSPERLAAVVDEAAAMGVRRVFVLGGGEPLLRKDTPALLHRIKALGMEGVLTTNGTKLDARLAEQLLADGWEEVHVSIDGATAEVHDRLRGQRGAFKRTVRNACRLSRLRRARGAAGPKLALHFVITTENVHQLADTVRLAHALGAHRVDFDALIAYRPEQQALALTDTQAQALPGLAREALAVADQLGIATTLAHFLDRRSVQRGQELPTGADAPGIHGAPCLKAWHYLVVQSDGRSSPCCVLAGEGGSVAERAVADVWADDPFLETIRRGMLDGRPHPRCRECSWNILAHERAIRSALPTDAADPPAASALSRGA